MAHLHLHISMYVCAIFYLLQLLVIVIAAAATAAVGVAVAAVGLSLCAHSIRVSGEDELTSENTTTGIRMRTGAGQSQLSLLSVG